MKKSCKFCEKVMESEYESFDAKFERYFLTRRYCNENCKFAAQHKRLYERYSKLTFL